MRTLAHAGLLTLAGLLSPLVSQANQDYFGATVAEVSGYSNTQSCVQFLLTGVAQADPVVPNNGWFAISASSPGGASRFCNASRSQNQRYNGTRQNRRYNILRCRNGILGIVTLGNYPP
jgi:hypothetical protein